MKRGFLAALLVGLLLMAVAPLPALQWKWRADAGQFPFWITGPGDTVLLKLSSGGTLLFQHGFVADTTDTDSGVATIGYVNRTAVGGSGSVDSFPLAWGLKTSASDSTLRPDSVVWVDSTTLDLRYLRAGDSTTTDTLAFHDNSLADTGKTLLAKTGNFDTTAGPGALNVAGNAWVRDTTTSRWFTSDFTASGVPPTHYGMSLDALDGLRLIMENASTNDTGSSLVIAPTYGAGVFVYTTLGHQSIVNWDGFENVDTVHKDVSGNPARRAYNGFAWNDTGMSNDGCGFAGIWQYESTRVVAMAESASGGINSFVATVGSATGNFADTSYMSSTLGFYTTTNCQADTFKGDGSQLTGTTVNGLDTTAIKKMVWNMTLDIGELVYCTDSATAFADTRLVFANGTNYWKKSATESTLTKDWRNKFILGASGDSAGTPTTTIAGGEKSVVGDTTYTPAGSNSLTAIADHTTSEINTGEGAAVDVVNDTQHEITAEPTFTGTPATILPPARAAWVFYRTYWP